MEPAYGPGMMTKLKRKAFFAYVAILVVTGRLAELARHVVLLNAYRAMDVVDAARFELRRLARPPDR